MRSAAMPRRKSSSWIAILLAVAVAFPSTKSLPGTYSSANQPGIDPSRYSSRRICLDFSSNS
jgi:uncharacterized membrane protein YdfJ with MMPL/SSD domain